MRACALLLVVCFSIRAHTTCAAYSASSAEFWISRSFFPNNKAGDHEIREGKENISAKVESPYGVVLEDAVVRRWKLATDTMKRHRSKYASVLAIHVGIELNETFESKKMSADQGEGTLDITFTAGRSMWLTIALRKSVLLEKNASSRAEIRCSVCELVQTHLAAPLDARFAISKECRCDRSAFAPSFARLDFPLGEEVLYFDSAQVTGSSKIIWERKWFSSSLDAASSASTSVPLGRRIESKAPLRSRRGETRAEVVGRGFHRTLRVIGTAIDHNITNGMPKSVLSEDCRVACVVTLSRFWYFDLDELREYRAMALGPAFHAAASFIDVEKPSTLSQQHVVVFFPESSFQEDVLSSYVLEIPIHLRYQEPRDDADGARLYRSTAIPHVASYVRCRRDDDEDEAPPFFSELDPRIVDSPALAWRRYDSAGDGDLCYVPVGDMRVVGFVTYATYALTSAASFFLLMSFAS